MNNLRALHVIRTTYPIIVFPFEQNGRHGYNLCVETNESIFLFASSQPVYPTQIEARRDARDFIFEVRSSKEPPKEVPNLISFVEGRFSTKFFE